MSYFSLVGVGGDYSRLDQTYIELGYCDPGIDIFLLAPDGSFQLFIPQQYFLERKDILLSHFKNQKSIDYYVRNSDKTILYHRLSLSLQQDFSNQLIDLFKKVTSLWYTETQDLHSQTNLITPEQYDSYQWIVNELLRFPKLLGFIEIKTFDQYTLMHSLNTAAFTINFLRYLQKHGKIIDQQIIINYGLAALLHDLGKNKIPKSILSSPKILTPTEYQLVMLHPFHGLNIISNSQIKVPKEVVDAIQFHHLRGNSTGYPARYQCSLEDIPIIARLIAIIDVFEAVTSSRRPYRRQISTSDALLMLRNDAANRLFDSQLVDSFSRSLTLN